MTSVPAARRPSIIPGILLGVLALILFAIGGAVALINSVGEALLASEATEIPNTLEADDLAAGGYAIYLTDDIGEPQVSDPVSSITCDVVNGGTTQTLVTNPFVSEETGSMELIATFSAVAGPASITCSWIDGHDSTGYFFVITPNKGVPVPAIVLFVLGGVVLVLGGLLILRAVLARQRR